MYLTIVLLPLILGLFSILSVGFIQKTKIPSFVIIFVHVVCLSFLGGLGLVIFLNLLQTHKLININILHNFTIGFLVIYPKVQFTALGALLISLSIFIFIISYVYILLKDIFIVNYRLIFYESACIVWILSCLISIIISSGLLFIYFAWQGSSLLCYFLVRSNKKNNDFRAVNRIFVINLISDIAFFIALFIILCQFRTLNLDVIFTQINSLQSQHLVKVKLAALFFMLAGMAKSGQILFHYWLPCVNNISNAANSLVIHGVIAIVIPFILLLKLLPIIMLFPSVLNLMIIIGLSTTFMVSFNVFASNNLKDIISYVMGYHIAQIFIAMGLLLFDFSLVYLINLALVSSILICYISEIFNTSIYQKYLFKIRLAVKENIFMFIVLVSIFFILYAFSFIVGTVLFLKASGLLVKFLIVIYLACGGLIHIRTILLIFHKPVGDNDIKICLTQLFGTIQKGIVMMTLLALGLFNGTMWVNSGLSNFFDMVFYSLTEQYTLTQVITTTVVVIVTFLLGYFFYKNFYFYSVFNRKFIHSESSLEYRCCYITSIIELWTVKIFNFLSKITIIFKGFIMLIAYQLVQQLKSFKIYVASKSFISIKSYIPLVILLLILLITLLRLYLK